MRDKLTDTDLLEMMSKKLETDYYTFGAYYDYNELDVKNIKNQIVEAIENKKFYLLPFPNKKHYILHNYLPQQY